MSTTVPSNFLKQSFQTWVSEHAPNDFRVHFDKSKIGGFIDFGGLYQLYEKNMTITFGGCNDEDRQELFEQLDELKFEMLQVLKTLSTHVDSITLTSTTPYSHEIQHHRGWIHAEELYGFKKQIVRFGAIQLYATIVYVHDDCSMHSVDATYEFETSAELTLQDALHFFDIEPGYEVRNVYLYGDERLIESDQWSVPMWTFTFPAYRIAIKMEAFVIV